MTGRVTRCSSPRPGTSACRRSTTVSHAAPSEDASITYRYTPSASGKTTPILRMLSYAPPRSRVRDPVDERAASHAVPGSPSTARPADSEPLVVVAVTHGLPARLLWTVGNRCSGSAAGAAPAAP